MLLGLEVQTAKGFGFSIPHHAPKSLYLDWHKSRESQSRTLAYGTYGHGWDIWTINAVLEAII